MNHTYLGQQWVVVHRNLLPLLHASIQADDLVSIVDLLGRTVPPQLADRAAGEERRGGMERGIRGKEGG